MKMWKSKSWQLEVTGVDGNVQLFGVNIFDYDWVDTKNRVEVNDFSYLNKQDNILYIGETNSTGCALFYYDATTLQLKSMFRKNEYGISNGTREIFHIGNEIFWGSYRFSDTNANQIIGRYGNSYSVNFVSNEIVSTFEGVFLTDTYECIVNYFDADFDFEYLLVTKSYNVFFRSRSVDKNVIIGVNFSMQ